VSGFHGHDPTRRCFYVLPHESIELAVILSPRPKDQAAKEVMCVGVYGVHCLHTFGNRLFFCCTCGAGLDYRRRPDSKIRARPRPTLAERTAAIRAITHGLGLPDHVVPIPEHPVPHWSEAAFTDPTEVTYVADAPADR
jgi:hypothetical protein